MFGHTFTGDLMLKVIVRTVLMYVFVSIGVRLMGKRQIGDMQPTELVVTLLISEIAAIPLQDTSQPISIGLVAIFMLVFTLIFANIADVCALNIVFKGKTDTFDYEYGSLEVRQMIFQIQIFPICLHQSKYLYLNTLK